MADRAQTPAPFVIGTDTWPGVAKLLEECGELSQVLGKLIATQGEPDHWDGTNLHRRLEDELGDVWGALRFVIQQSDQLDGALIADRADAKFLRFLRWQREAERV